MTTVQPGHGNSTISWAEEERIGTLILNTPPSNAMTTRFFREMGSLEVSKRNGPGFDGIIIKGSGRHFSSGADLGDLLAMVSGIGMHDRQEAAEREHYLLDNYRSFQRLEKLNIPVVALIRGVCIGSAFELALHCHFRFCSEDAVFGLPESTFNLMPGLGGIRKISELAGNATAMELSLRGNTFGAREALELRLVDRIVPKKELEPLARSFIRHTRNNYHRFKRTLYLNRYFTSHGPVTS